MASNGPETLPDNNGGAPPQSVSGPAAQSSTSEQFHTPLSTPIEMDSLRNPAITGDASREGQTVGTSQAEISGALQEDSSEIQEAPKSEISQQEHGGTETPEIQSHPPLNRADTAPAIGPATDKPTPLTREATTEGHVLYITLLLASTGARHPYKLDAKYLRKRGVEVEDNNPINISLYKLKELILRDWREEWNARPTSPESIRLITMGKLLNDKARLADSGFTNGLTPHIVHMTVKPQDIIDEEEANKAAGKDRDGNERSPGCRCIIQ